MYKGNIYLETAVVFTVRNVAFYTEAIEKNDKYSVFNILVNHPVITIVKLAEVFFHVSPEMAVITV